MAMWNGRPLAAAKWAVRVPSARPPHDHALEPERQQVGAVGVEVDAVDVRGSLSAVRTVVTHCHVAVSNTRT